MNNPLPVRRLQGVRYLHPPLQQMLGPDWLSPNAMLQRLAFEQLHHNELPPFLFADVVNRADVRMVQGRSGSGLALKSLNRMAVLGNFIGQEFESDLAAKPSVFSFVHH